MDIKFSLSQRENFFLNDPLTNELPQSEIRMWAIIYDTNFHKGQRFGMGQGGRDKSIKSDEGEHDEQQVLHVLRSFTHGMASLDCASVAIAQRH